MNIEEHENVQQKAFIFIRRNIKENHHQGLQQLLQCNHVEYSSVRLIFITFIRVLYDFDVHVLQIVCFSLLRYIICIFSCAITSFYLVYHLKVQTINISLYDCCSKYIPNILFYCFFLLIFIILFVVNKCAITLALKIVENYNKPFPCINPL